MTATKKRPKASVRRQSATKKRPKAAVRPKGATKKVKASRFKTTLMVLAVVRIVLGIVAIPLASSLYRKHFLILVLMRPTKEVLLFGGFLARQHKVDLLQIVIAAVPLAILGVWHAFALGRAWAKEIRSGDMPGIGNRVIPVKKVLVLQKALKKKGAKLVLIGRLAVFPSAVLGMAAGSAKMDTKTFLGIDALGGVLSVAETLAAGYALGAAYRHGKFWLTAIGVAALIAFGVVLGRALKRTP